MRALREGPGGKSGVASPVAVPLVGWPPTSWTMTPAEAGDARATAADDPIAAVTTPAVSRRVTWFMMFSLVMRRPFGADDDPAARFLRVHE
jgi:hypothetical protein